MATELYVGGWDNPSQQAVFGKIDSETGAYTQISSGLGMTFDSFTGLAWDPGISAFHTLSEEGLLSTITKTGTTGSPTGGGPRGRGRLAYNTNTGQLHRLAGKDPDPDPHPDRKYRSISTWGYTFHGTAFVKGKLCCTVSKMFDPRMYYDPQAYDDPRIEFQNSGKNNDFYGLFDLETARFQEIFSDRAFHAMQLAYDGSTLFGLNDNTLYTLNPETGAYTQVANVSGISGNTFLQCISAIQVIAS